MTSEPCPAQARFHTDHQHHQTSGCRQLADELMASSDHGSSLFERDKVASSVSADEALPFLADHGFFYQSDGEIGKLVLQLYARKASNQLEGLSLFRQRLQSDPVSESMSVFCSSSLTSLARSKNTRALFRTGSICCICLGYDSRATPRRRVLRGDIQGRLQKFPLCLYVSP